ncbi:MAG: hypothetical protein IPN97_12135 [Saprospiraceae bacterium]|nr:hypothetical protein [Saprospiraceae bacterium]
MKNLFLICIMTICVHQINGQRVKKPKINYFMGGDIGFMFEKYNGFDDKIYEKINPKMILKSGNNYLGFYPISFGFSKLKNKKLSDLQVEWVDLKSNFTSLHYSQNGVDTILTPRTSRSLSLHYFFSLYQIGEKNIFYVGPSLGAGYFRHRLGNKYSAFSNFIFPLSTSCACMHLGIRMNYQIVLNKFWRLNIASRLVLLDAGFYRERRLDPSLPPKAQITSEGFSAEFWRNQYPLTIGLRYRIK